MKDLLKQDAEAGDFKMRITIGKKQEAIGFNRRCIKCGRQLVASDLSNRSLVRPKEYKDFGEEDLKLVMDKKFTGWECETISKYEDVACNPWLYLELMNGHVYGWQYDIWLNLHWKRL